MGTSSAIKRVAVTPIAFVMSPQRRRQLEDSVLREQRKTDPQLRFTRLECIYGTMGVMGVAFGAASSVAALLKWMLPTLMGTLSFAVGTLLVNKSLSRTYNYVTAVKATTAFQKQVVDKASVEFTSYS